MILKRLCRLLGWMILGVLATPIVLGILLSFLLLLATLGLFLVQLWPFLVFVACLVAVSAFAQWLFAPPREP